MTDRRDDDARLAWHLWKGPAFAWVALIVLFALTLGTAYLPLGTGNIAVNLAIAVVMAGVLAVFLMDLQNANALIRIVGGAGLFWLSLMFILTFNDYLSRHY